MSNLIAQRNAIQDERKKATVDMEALLKKVAEEKRAFTAEEQQQFDRMAKVVEDGAKMLENIDRQMKLESSLDYRAVNSVVGAVAKVESRFKDYDYRKEGLKLSPQGEKRAKAEYSEAFVEWFERGVDSRQILQTETRADFTAAGAGGGNAVVVPIAVARQIMLLLDNAVFVRRVARKWTLEQAVTLQIPIGGEVNDAQWVTDEITAPVVDASTPLSSISITPAYLRHLERVSERFLRLAVADVEAFIANAFANAFARTEEKDFLTGNGTANRPIGVFNSTASGCIPTSRDVSTGNTPTAVTYAGLVNALYSIPAQYRNRPSFAWGISRDLLRQVMLIVDSSNRPIFNIDPRTNYAGTILGVPYYESEYIPNTFTTGNYVGIVGDWSYYHVVDSLEYRVQRLNELYAVSGQIGWVMFRELSAKPSHPTAWARVKLA